MACPIGKLNCRHIIYSIILGVSEPNYSEEELQAMKKASLRKKEFDGKEYTNNEASQVQRRLEREIRKQKNRSVLAASAGDDEMRREAQMKINQLTGKYKDLSDAFGIPTKMERTSVSGFRPAGAKFRQSHSVNPLARNVLIKAVPAPKTVPIAPEKAPIATEKLVDNSKSAEITITHNALGKSGKIVNHIELTNDEPNSITQKINRKGGIDRNYYDENGRQIKQISNNDHNHKKEKDFGKHGEHAHDYQYDDNGNLISRNVRELTEEERKENEDIL